MREDRSSSMLNGSIGDIEERVKTKSASKHSEGEGE